MAENLDALRGRLCMALPDRIAAAVDSYGRFAAAEAPEDAKGFAAHHAACRAALAHMDLLVKLARWAEAGQDDAPPAEDDSLDRLLAEARSALDDMD